MTELIAGDQFLVIRRQNDGNARTRPLGLGERAIDLARGNFRHYNLFAFIQPDEPFAVGGKRQRFEASLLGVGPWQLADLAGDQLEKEQTVAVGGREGLLVRR